MILNDQSDSLAIDEEKFLGEIQALLGHPIPEKAVLYVSDFRRRTCLTTKPGADPLVPSFDFNWGLDAALRLKLVLDQQEGRAFLEQTMGGTAYNSILYWDESRLKGLAFDEDGFCDLQPEETQRLVNAFNLPMYQQWNDAVEAPTVPALLSKLAAMAQGMRKFLNQGQQALLTALRTQGAGLHAELDALAAGLRSTQPALAQRGTDALHRAIGLPENASRLPEVLLTMEQARPDGLDLGVDWGGATPASPPMVEVEFNGVPIQAQIVWRDGVKQFALQAEALGRQPLELGWDWRLSDHRLRLFFRPDTRGD